MVYINDMEAFGKLFTLIIKTIALFTPRVYTVYS